MGCNGVHSIQPGNSVQWRALVLLGFNFSINEFVYFVECKNIIDITNIKTKKIKQFIFKSPCI